MRPGILAAAVGLSIVALAQPLDAQRGAGGRIQNMTATDDATIPIRLFTITGQNPCTTIQVDYGDGEVVNHPITDLPVTFGVRFRLLGGRRGAQQDGGEGGEYGRPEGSVREGAVHGARALRGN